MQNDFEKDIAQRMQDFSITPQPEIWQQVEAALPPEKKRRRAAIWWWLLPLAVLLGGGIWLILNEQPTGVSKGKKETQQTTSTTNKTAKETKEQSRGDSNINTVSVLPIQKKEKANKPLQKTDSTFSIKESISNDKQQAAIQHSVSKARQKKLTRKADKSIGQAEIISTNSFIVQNGSRTANQKADPASDDIEKGLQTPAGNVSVVKSEATYSSLVKDTLPASLVQLKIALDSIDSTRNTADTTTKALQINTAVAKHVSNKKNRPIWMLEVGIGQSWQREPGEGGGQYARDALNAANPSNPTGSVPSISIPAFTPPKASYTFSLGIARKQAISRHWNWQIALHYQLLSTTQHYGSTHNSVNNNYSTADAALIYTPGDTSVYHNYAHQVQVVPRIEYIINPASRVPVSINTGFALAYNVGGNQLLQDDRNHNYIRSSAYTTKWLSAIEIGTGFMIHKKVYAGITYQHGLSNVARPALQSDYRWRLWQVRLGLPLFNHSSK